MGPFVLPQPGITGRYLQQERGTAASVHAGIPHPFKCAAAAVQLLSHPLLSPPNTPCGCSDVLAHPLVYHTPLGPPASCTSSPGLTRYHIPHRIPHPVKYFSIPKCYHRGVFSCVSYGILFLSCLFLLFLYFLFLPFLVRFLFIFFYFLSLIFSSLFFFSFFQLTCV